MARALRKAPDMRAHAGRSFVIGFLLATFAVPMPFAFAQDAAPAPAAPSGLVPPELTEGATPEYPESKKAAAEKASVVLSLTIASSGAVEGIAVTTSAGPAFDEAALLAAKRLVFKPAMRDGKPIAARIPYRFDFAVESAPLPPPPPPPAAVVPSDAVAPEGGAPAAAAEAPDAPQEVRVAGAKPAREVTRRAIEQREIARMPGTNGDAIRAVENLPGVARPPGFQGLLIVRGSAPQDTGVFVDGTQIPLAFHFGGVSSVVPSSLLERIDFLPGNFGPEYGRAMGGNIDIGLRSPVKDRIHGMAQIDLIDARLVVEAPLGEKTRFLVAGRRSHVDAWIGGALKAGGAVGVRTAPVYYDYQAMLEHDVTSTTTARLTLFGSDDALRLTLNSAGGDPALAGDLSHASRFYRIQARTDTRLSESTRWINTLSYGQDRVRTSIGNNFSIDVTQNPLALRSDLRTKLTDGVTAVFGLDTVWTAIDATVLGSAIQEDSQPAGPYFGRQRNLQHVSTDVVQPAGYAMLELSPVKALKLLPSVRADYSSDIKEWIASPRFAARYDIASGYPRTTLKGGVGLYNQPPQPYQSVPPFGTPSLKSNRALHTGLGVEQELTRDVEVSVEGFYKRLDNLVDQRPDATSQQAGVTYGNNGSGRIYGGELLLRYKPDDKFFGWVAYTISRSERRSNDSEAFHLFEYDQTHILTALGSYRLGRGWELGARWRYVTGSPYTPVASATYDADAGTYAPLNATPFSGRDEAFHRLDVRVDKTWTFKDWKLGAYLDLQNAYFHENAEGRSYSHNYARSGAVAGLPFLPVFGLRGEL
jgi:TonB family protein